MKERKIPRNQIGSLKNMQKTLANWKSVDEGCAVQSRVKWLKNYTEMKYNVYDINVALVWLFDKFKPKSYLEIGVLKGGSLVHALLAPSVKRIVGIDAFARSQYAGIEYSKKWLEENVINKFSGKSVKIIKSLSQQALKGMVEKFDIITVDGDHSKNGAKADLDLCLPLAKKAIVFDDILHHSHLYLTDVALEFAKDNDLDYTINYQTPGTVIFWIK